MQFWSVVAVTDPARKDRLAALAGTPANRASENNRSAATGWAAGSSRASSARTRPIDGANLKPWPENPAATTTRPTRSSTKSWSGVVVYVQETGTSRSASAPGTHVRT
ncbi:hypothetical protein OERS_26170 [Oerskovia enterophila]|uniref:Uncharacterized protein n=1 Tax=Oerskovia enterophila TaxID=43678 RepID=A0ABX2Y2W4_9CELL|nr:hypothetical protein OERS_26170 [Oerskovia enterophila]